MVIRVSGKGLKGERCLLQRQDASIVSTPVFASNVGLYNVSDILLLWFARRGPVYFSPISSPQQESAVAARR